MEVNTTSHLDGPAWAWKLTKRRKKPGDSFFEEGNCVCNLAYKQLSVMENQLPPKRVPEFPCHVSRCHQVFSTVTAYEVHYSSVHRNVCCQCRRSFPTSHLLDVHLLEWHDTMFQIMAAKQKMYQCLVQECLEKFSTPKERKNHVIKVHHYPSNFRFDRPVKQRHPKLIKSAEDSMEIDSTIDDKNREPRVTEAKDELKGTSAEIQQNMDISNTAAESQGRKFVCKVPHNICFGHGASRGFHRPRSQGKKHGKKKHWHQQGAQSETDTTVSIEEVSMTDLAVALDNFNS